MAYPHNKELLWRLLIVIFMIITAFVWSPLQLNLDSNNALHAHSESTQIYTKCQDYNMGKEWFNEHFQSNWIPLCLPPQQQSHSDKTWTTMKCSMYNNTFRMCELHNVYFQLRASGEFAFKLRCDPASNNHANHIFNGKNYTAITDPWRNMRHHKPNKKHFDFQPMSDSQLYNTSYLQSFIDNMDNNTYYYDWVGGNWCNNFRTTSKKSSYWGNMWHCVAFLTHLFSLKYANDALYEPSTYIFGPDIDSIHMLESQFITEDDEQIPALMKPLFTNFLFMSPTKKNEKDIFMKQMYIYSNPILALIWNDQHEKNYKKCAETQHISPIISAFKAFYEEKAHMMRILRNIKDSIEDILHSKRVQIYYDHKLIPHNNNSIVRDLMMDKSGDDIIYVSNRWITSNYCESRCIKNNEEWISKIVQRFSGLIIYGNPTYLRFSTQMFLFRKINMYFGMHGAGFAWSLFMKPHYYTGHKLYYIFEISPTHKNIKRTAEPLAAYVGICYNNIIIDASEDTSVIDVTSTMKAIEDGLEKCRMSGF